MSTFNVDILKTSNETVGVNPVSNENVVPPSRYKLKYSSGYYTLPMLEKQSRKLIITIIIVLVILILALIGLYYVTKWMLNDQSAGPSILFLFTSFITFGILVFSIDKSYELYCVKEAAKNKTKET